MQLDMGSGVHEKADLEIHLCDIYKVVIGVRCGGKCLEGKMVSHIAFRSTGI